ncbi:hypothetical protein HDZ31DRAFT_34194 [Schizophyllum fasciatum]
MSKLMWFALGAGVATLWSRKHAERVANGAYDAAPGPAGPHHGGPHGWHGGWHGGCHRRGRETNADATAQQQLPPAPVDSSPAPQYSPPASQSSPPATQTQAQAWPGYHPPWDEAKFRQAQQQARESAAEMTESALESLTTQLQSWKQHLAEQRIQREAEAQKQNKTESGRFV